MLSTVQSQDLVCESSLGFGRWLVVHPDVLGLISSVRIGGVEVTMALPRLPNLTEKAVQFSRGHCCHRRGHIQTGSQRTPIFGVRSLTGRRASRWCVPRSCGSPSPMQSARAPKSKRQPSRVVPLSGSSSSAIGWHHYVGWPSPRIAPLTITVLWVFDRSSARRFGGLGQRRWLGHL
jgi:hypothetical protein